jgi:HSP20 family molecular chaperone IbpA
MKPSIFRPRFLERRMDDPLSELIREMGRPWWPLFFQEHPDWFVPAADVLNRNGDLVVQISVPGVDPDKDVTITLEDGRLVVRGERRASEEVREENYYRRESRFGSFERAVPVPPETTENDVTATYSDGILEVVVKGAAEAADAKEAPSGTKIPIRLPEGKRTAGK